MAAEIDPKTEALVRQVHRELNGLTRTSRRANPTYGLSFDSNAAGKQLQQHHREKDTRSEGAGAVGGVVKRSRAEKEGERERERDREHERDNGRSAVGIGGHRKRTSPQSTRQRQRRVQGVDDSDNAEFEEEEEGESDQSDDDEYESTRTSSTSEESELESETQACKRHRGGSSRDGSKGDREGSRADQEGGKQRDRERQEREQRYERERRRERVQDQEQRMACQTGASANPRSAVPIRTDPAASAPKAEGPGPHQQGMQNTRDLDRYRSHAIAVQDREAAGVNDGLATESEPEINRAVALQQQLLLEQLQQQMAEQHLSSLEAAAAAASAAVKEQAKTTGQVADQRLVKCFHAGVRWGIKLSRQALQTRSDLATALNDAFAGEILSCGRGETLYIVFLDAQGKTSEFPSLRGPNGRGKDSATKWRAMVDRAVKIYVRRS
ncbi:hypothetical protein VaNZ11_000225 [Volvox africanus]|uniref:CKK domain-containing protein n=1 Tax=Volvox africanus TaxID=51714 RepID=A0ABQ5RLJ6_9CHLO|nr:hypothetical protein VaNZ11_000225 [Volvox africanus]